MILQVLLAPRPTDVVHLQLLQLIMLKTQSM